jgi:hypothetical protein
MAAPRLVDAPPEKLQELEIRRQKWQEKYNQEVSERKSLRDAEIRKAFLRKYPDWECLKYSLPLRYRIVLELCHGLSESENYQVYSLSQVGKIIGCENGNPKISRQGIQRIKDRALQELIMLTESKESS